MKTEDKIFTLVMVIIMASASASAPYVLFQFVGMDDLTLGVFLATSMVVGLSIVGLIVSFIFVGIALGKIK